MRLLRRAVGRRAYSVFHIYLYRKRDDLPSREEVISFFVAIDERVFT